MPVEAIHLSALLDSLAVSEARRLLHTAPLREHARLGAVLIDFPYFERFPLGVLRYLLARPLAVSVWGDLFHTQRPVGIGKQLLFAARRLRTEAPAAAERVLAVALGYISHVAVDLALHPLVNYQAAQRAQRLGELAARQHSEVEKFHSVLFHQERLGFDFMGRKELRQHIQVDAHAIHRDAALCEAFVSAVNTQLNTQLTPALLAAWARGYRQYVALVSSPAGKLLMPEQVKREVREEVYAGAWGQFATHYAGAVERSRQSLDVACALYFGGANEAAAFDALLPEGSIDAPAKAP